MKKVVRFSGLLCILLAPSVAIAGFTETLPKGTFFIEESYIHAGVDNAWKNDATLGMIIDPMERFEVTTGEKLGTLIPRVEASHEILVNQLQYGILDNLTMVLAIPVVMKTKVDPNFGWEPGDDTNEWGVFDTVDDFWEWAAGYGQPKIETWEGNYGTLSDIVLGTRLRFSDWISHWFKQHGLAGAVTLYGAIPTGSPPDPEEVVSAGTTTWSLHFQGEIGFHASADYTLGFLDDRVTLGTDLFYEIFLRHEYESAIGTKHPVILKDEDLEVGPTYTVDPGDFIGASFGFDLVPLKGPAWATWLSSRSEEKARGFPPLLTLTFRYTHTRIGQTDWGTTYGRADWEWEDKEEIWLPGYKNILTGLATVSLLRLGVPLQIYGGLRNQTWLPGKNYRAANTYTAGLRIPLKFW